MLPSHVLQLLFLVYLLVIFQKKKSRKKINPVVLATSFFKNVGCGVERAINALYTNWLYLYLIPSPLYGMHMGLSFHKGLNCIVIRSRQHAYTTYCQGGVTLMYPVLYDLHPLNKVFLA